MARIFWVEDQMHWVNRFKPIMEAEQFDDQPTEVVVHRFAEAACQAIMAAGHNEKPDLAILDANMNGNDHAGFQVRRALLKKWPDLQIIYLSEHSGTDIEQQAFEQADTRDFIAKHQQNIEAVLCWRIKALLKQPPLPHTDKSNSADELDQGDLHIDLATWEVFWKGSKLMNPANSARPLAPMPRKILRYLVEASPRALNTEQMCDRLQADPERFSYDSYRQHISTLRKSFDQAEGGDGSFIDGCKKGQGIVALGDEGAYCWKAS